MPSLKLSNHWNTLYRWLAIKQKTSFSRTYVMRFLRWTKIWDSKEMSCSNLGECSATILRLNAPSDPDRQLCWRALPRASLPSIAPCPNCPQYWCGTYVPDHHLPPPHHPSYQHLLHQPFKLWHRHTLPELLGEKIAIKWLDLGYLVTPISIKIIIRIWVDVRYI